MNREDAYNRIDAIIAKHEIDDEYVTITSALDYDALRVARKALVQQPCKDAIGREDMLDAIGHGTTYTSEELQRIIKGLPSVTPQQKAGHWKQYGNSWEDKFKCSECEKEQPKILCGERIIGHWSDYCPNCGAKMVEP